ncbi:MAG: pyruvate formate lyase-activating protein [Clostridia bacterium]|nr:pyruvate formate lyase-activating protein [Clostridia bacterium]
MIGYIHSLQSLGTVDGPGVRAVVFAQGCPYRCAYCHNPDTWKVGDGEAISHDELIAKIARLKSYIKDGGVTLSGGEPCLQADFFIEITKTLHGMGLHVALDTSGAVTGERAMELVRSVDLVLLDVKFNTEEEYSRYTGGSLAGAMKILGERERMGAPVWIRRVILPGINDTDTDLEAFAELIWRYECIEKLELLPFRKLCLEKYESLGIPFPASDIPEAKESDCERLSHKLSELITSHRKSKK